MDEVFGSAQVAESAVEAAEPWPETVEAAERLRAVLIDGTLRDGELFDTCVRLDRPFAERQVELAELIADIGGIDRVGPLTHDTPARAGWLLHGPRGAIRCGIAMTPLATTRVQRLDIARDPLHDGARP
jgi:hypothetical protein